MAQKRMIDKKISVSEQVSNLPIEAQLIFTWSIPHSDDVGLLPHSLKTLKAIIIPMIDMNLETFGNHWKDIENQKLILEIEYKGEKFYLIKTFLKNQSLKRDRQPNTILRLDYCEKPTKSWEKLLNIINGFQMENNVFHLDTEVKRREEKLREDIYGIFSLKEETNIIKIMYNYEDIDEAGNPIKKKNLKRIDKKTNEFLISIGFLWRDMVMNSLNIKKEDVILLNIYYPIRKCWDREKWNKEEFKKLFNYFFNDRGMKEENKISFDLCLSQKYVAKYKLAQKKKPQTNASISSEIIL